MLIRIGILISESGNESSLKSVFSSEGFNVVVVPAALVEEEGEVFLPQDIQVINIIDKIQFVRIVCLKGL